jgi:signal transduction histidine kinase
MPVLGNAEALRQVIMNLLSNAEKYSGETREISLSCGLDGRFAVVGIADRGIGVAPGMADKIFQEFFRCDDSLSAARSGAGLGLSIARDISRKHGGDVRYAPRPGGGSVFSLSLPLIEDA